MIYSIICSRREKPPLNFIRLLDYFNRAGVAYWVAYDQEGIFQGYENAFKMLNPKDDDIVILCHDDIQIFTDTDLFTTILTENLLDTSGVGFVGVAGTTTLGQNAMWWDPQKRAAGKHRGFVFQGSNFKTMTPNYFGPHGNVVALDGLFLASTGKVLREIGLGKPESYDNGWDFYDLHYTVTAYEKGYFNRTVPIILTHYSDGMMRPSWEKNRICFIKEHRLPIVCN